MLKKAQAGDRVRLVTEIIGTTKTGGEVDAHWTAVGELNAATVVDVEKLDTTRMITVEPDPPGFGLWTFMPQDLERINDD